MTCRVQLTAQAQADIDRNFARPSNRSEEGALHWYESFWAAAERLKRIPRSCVVAPDSDDFDEDIRLMTYGTRKGRTYRALFVIRGDLVQILCIRGPGERPVNPEEIEP